MVNSFDAALSILDGLDEAIIGVAYKAGADPVVVYDRDKIIDVLIDVNDWDRTDAEEYYSFNIHQFYIGESTPLILDRSPVDMEDGTLSTLICLYGGHDDCAGCDCECH